MYVTSDVVASWSPYIRGGWVEPFYCNDKYLYHLQTKLQKGNVFTPVCQSFCSEGMSSSLHVGIHNPPGQTPPGQTPPWADTQPPGQTPIPEGRHPSPWANTPLGRHPPGHTHPLGRHPLIRHPLGTPIPLDRYSLWQTPSPCRWLLQRTVCILLECIIVVTESYWIQWNYFGNTQIRSK